MKEKLYGDMFAELYANKDAITGTISLTVRDFTSKNIIGKLGIPKEAIPELIRYLQENRDTRYV